MHLMANAWCRVRESRRNQGLTIQWHGGLCFPVYQCSSTLYVWLAQRGERMVELQGIAFGYRRGERLFAGLDLTLTPGNVYGLLGRNGAGKTTLLRLMAGLLFPKAGSARVAGEEVRRRTPAFLRELYFVPEEFHTPALAPRGLVSLYSIPASITRPWSATWPGSRSESAHDRHLRTEEEGAARLRGGQQLPPADARRTDQRARHSRQEPVPPPAGRRRGRRAGDPSPPTRLWFALLLLAAGLAWLLLADPGAGVSRCPPPSMAGRPSTWSNSVVADHRRVEAAFAAIAK